MGQMRDADWSRETLLRSDWLIPIVAPITTGTPWACFSVVHVSQKVQQCRNAMVW